MTQYQLNELLIKYSELDMTDFVKALVKEGADPCADYNRLIKYAAYNGHTETVKYLVSVGADPCVNHNIPIEWAAENGHTETVKYLVSVGAPKEYLDKLVS